MKWYRHTEDKWYYVKNTMNWVHKRRGSNFVKEIEKNDIVATITTKQWRTPNAGFIKIYKDELSNEFIENNFIELSIFYDDKKDKLYYLRILTEEECYLLMGFSEQDYLNVYNSLINCGLTKNRVRDQIYKQAGNSIVVNVLVAIFNKMAVNYD